MDGCMPGLLNRSISNADKFSKKSLFCHSVLLVSRRVVVIDSGVIVESVPLMFFSFHAFSKAMLSWLRVFSHLQEYSSSLSSASLVGPRQSATAALQSAMALSLFVCRFHAKCRAIIDGNCRREL